MFRTICSAIRDARMNGEESLIEGTTGGVGSGTGYTKPHKGTVHTVHTVGPCHGKKRKRNHQSSSEVDVGWEEAQAKNSVA